MRWRRENDRDTKKKEESTHQKMRHERVRERRRELENKRHEWYGERDWGDSRGVDRNYR